MRVIGYARVSGKSQIDGDGFPRQSAAIEKFCVSNTLPLESVRQEKGVSGTTDCFDRPVFFDILTSLGEGDIIVVERADRLARELMTGEILLKECRQRKLKVYSVDRGLLDIASDGADPTVILIRQVLFAVAQFEKSALVLKLRSARQRVKAKTGRCEGRPFYGETANERRILQTAVNIFNTVGNYDVTAKMLNDGGFKTRYGKPWTRQNTRGIITSHIKHNQAI